MHRSPPSIDSTFATAVMHSIEHIRAEIASVVAVIEIATVVIAVVVAVVVVVEKPRSMTIVFVGC